MGKRFNRALLCRLFVITLLAAGTLSLLVTDTYAALYRVYLARPTTQPPIWDWAQTVVAPDEERAIAFAYQDWTNSNPNPPVPPLSQCRKQANKRGPMQIE